MSESSLTKVHVDLPTHWATNGESLWATELGADHFRIEDVPFYAYDLNYLDVVEAKAARPDLKPSIMRVVQRSGHHTMRVIFNKGVSEDVLLERLRSLGDLHVSFEGCSRFHFALDLAPEANIDVVEQRLQDWISEGLADYETCEARVPGSFDDAPTPAEEE